MIKKYLIKFMLFMAFDFIVISISQEEEPLKCLFLVCFPYNENTGDLRLTYFSLNICSCLIFISAIIQSIDEQFLMNDYILTRTNRKRALKATMYKTMNDVFILLTLKGISNLLFGNLDGTLNFYYWLNVVLSIILTLLIWIFLCYILFQKQMPMKNSYCLILFLIVLSQCFVDKIPVLSLFIFGSKTFLTSPILCIVFKFVVVMCLYVLNVVLFGKYEHTRKTIEI